MLLPLLRLPPLLLLPLLMVSCDAADGGTQAAYPPPTVKTVTLEPSDVPIEREYPGRVAPIRLAEVRARVTGIVLARQFSEGTDVASGDVLFQIDPARFEAAVDAAKAQVAKAEAALSLAGQQEARAKGLLLKNVASKEQYDVASASRKEAEAEVAVARANLKTAELELSYSTVRAPIAGRIGAALVTEGAFVRQEDATQMATVRDLTSVYVDFIAPLEDMSKIQEQSIFEAHGKMKDGVAIQLVTNEGSLYGEPGNLLFSSAVVNETTGQVSLRAQFKNPGRRLLPGTYVRVRMTQGFVAQALLVPQRAIQWDTLGQARVMTVLEGKAVSLPVVTGRSLGNRWLVTEGLKPGDQVIVDGAEKAMPGTPVAAESIPDEGASNAALESDCSAVCSHHVKL